MFLGLVTVLCATCPATGLGLGVSEAYSNRAPGAEGRNMVDDGL